MSSSRSRVATTQWSLELALYWYLIFAFLRRRGHSIDEAVRW